MYCYSSTPHGLIFPPVNCCAFVHIDKRDTHGFESFRPLTRAQPFSRSEYCSFREDCPLRTRAAAIRGGCLNWKGYYHLRPLDRLTTTVTVETGLM